MTILIGTLLTMGLISLLYPVLIPLILFVLITTRIILWLCPALRKHIEQQRTLYNDIDEYESPHIEHDMPDVILYHMIKDNIDYGSESVDDLV